MDSLVLGAQRVMYDTGINKSSVDAEVAQLAQFDIPEAQKYDSWRRTELWADIRQRILANAEQHLLTMEGLCADPVTNQSEIIGRRYARADLLKLVAFVEDSGKVLAEKVARYNQLVEITRTAEQYKDNRFPVSL